MDVEHLEAEDQGGFGPEVFLPAFEGPLDLLLHLIRKNRVSIYDIPVAEICGQYQRHLSAMQELDLEIAGEFLWMAAWLIHLKSKMLLPRPEAGEEDPRIELVERLLEYRRVKELAGMLYDRHVMRSGVWVARVDANLPSAEPELDWEDVDLTHIARTYLEVMERYACAHPPPMQVLPLRHRVQDTMKSLYEAVRASGRYPLLRNLEERADSEEVVVTVVATLELARLGGVVAEQERAFAEVFLIPGRVDLDAHALLQHGGPIG